MSHTSGDALPLGPTYQSTGDIAASLGVSTPIVKQLLRDRAVVGIRVDRVVHIPAEFVDDGEIVKGLAGTITVLTDAGYSDRDIVEWLFDQSRGPRSAMAELRDGRARYVHRQAQIAVF